MNVLILYNGEVSRVTVLVSYNGENWRDPQIPEGLVGFSETDSEIYRA